MLTQSGIQLTKRTRDIHDLAQSFHRICDENGIEHRLTKVKHPWKDAQVEGMNGIIKNATFKRFH